MAETAALAINMSKSRQYARPDSLRSFEDFFGDTGQIEKASLEELASSMRAVASVAIRAAAIGRESEAARGVCEEALSAGLLRQGDGLTVVSLGTFPPGRDHAPSAFEDWLDGAGPLRTRAPFWRKPRDERNLRTRTFDVVIYPNEDKSEPAVFSALSRHASISLFRHSPDNLTPVSEALARLATVEMGRVFAQPGEKEHWLPLLTDGTKKSAKEVYRRAAACVGHQTTSCDVDCPAFYTQELLDELHKVRS